MHLLALPLVAPKVRATGDPQLAREVRPTGDPQLAQEVLPTGDLQQAREGSVEDPPRPGRSAGAPPNGLKQACAFFVGSPF